MLVDVGAVAAWIAAIMTIGGAIMGVARLFMKLSRMDEKLDMIMAEQCVLVKGNRAALNGLKQLNCNGPVTEALDELENHLNKQAHR